MKKAALIVLFCFGTVLLLDSARADETGFGGEIIVGGLWKNTRRSQLDASDGNDRIDALVQNEDRETDTTLDITGELTYTLANLQTSLFLTGLAYDSGVAMGARQGLGDWGQLQIAGTFSAQEVWKDPYLVGVKRSRTDETTVGLSIEYEEIFGTGFLFSSHIAGVDVVQAYMRHVQDAAEEAVRTRLKELSEEKGMAEVDTVRALDHLDDGSPIALTLTIDRRDGSASLDFHGTGTEIWGNCNAPKAVTKSAILYCLRCLIKKDLPLNYGCLIPINIIVPEGSLLAPSPDAAVVGGNVLTSQRITDVVFKAFGVAAASQGCMNNFTFGNDRFGYYETIGGGAGAGPTWHGQTGVHTHMTNTRITDPEILERRYPVLLRRFSVRQDSGGNGRFKGGNGLVRELEFLEALNMAILSERRVFAPYGLEGGQPGRRGVNLFIREDGRRINLGAKNEIVAQPGDRFRIMSPGGGGFGAES